MSAKKESSTSSIDDIINSEFTEMQDLSKEDDSVREWIDSGNYALNYICSRNFLNGYPVGQITAFYGQSGTGKSMLPAIASKDPKIDRVIVLDSEGGGTGRSLFQFIGADLSKIRYQTVQTLDSWKVNKETGKIEEVSDKDVPFGKLETSTSIYHMGLILLLKKLLYAIEYNHTKEKILIIIDSLSNMKSVRASLLGGEDMGKTNKLLNVLFSSLDNTLKNTNSTILFANKVYTDLNNAYNTEGVISGGQSVIYNPSLMIGLTTLQDNPEISDTELKEEKERRKTGLGNSLKTVRARIKKSRFGTEGRNAWIVLDSTYGLTRYSGLFNLLCDFGVCVKNGSRYSIPGIIVNGKGEDVSFYKKEFIDVFRKDEHKYITLLQEKMEAVEEKLKEKAMNLEVNDLEEVKDAEEDGEISNLEMMNMMEAEKEMDVSE
jgi:RecA/RadA recombinase